MRLYVLTTLALLACSGCSGKTELSTVGSDYFESPAESGKSPRIQIAVEYKSSIDNITLKYNLLNLLGDYNREKVRVLNLSEVQQLNDNKGGQSWLSCRVTYTYNKLAKVDTTATCVKNDNKGVGPLKPLRTFNFTGDVFTSIKEIVPSTQA